MTIVKEWSEAADGINSIVKGRKGPADKGQDVYLDAGKACVIVQWEEQSRPNMSLPTRDAGFSSKTHV